jgi:signal transduction histidine kinase
MVCKNVARAAGRATVPPLILMSVTIALGLTAALLAWSDGRVSTALPGAVPVACAVVGVVILHYRPGHPIGWLLITAGLSAAVVNAGTAYAWHAVAAGAGSLHGVQAVETIVNLAPLPALGLLVGLLPQIFPTGSAISPRWRPGIAAGWVFIVAGTIGNVFAVENIQDLPDVPNPAAIPAAQPVWNIVQLLALLALVTSVGYGLAALIVRWRRARGDQRQQLKWFVAGTLPVLPAVALHDEFPVVTGYLIAALLLLVPVTIGVAVLKYRLYDLDLVLGRILKYTALSACVAAVYLAIVLLLELVAGVGHGLVVQIGATIVAAGLFQPLRQRVQHAVDRLFYGDRARPYEVLTRLGAALEHAQAPDAALALVVNGVASALRVPYAAINLLVGDEVITTAQYGETTQSASRFPLTYQDDTVGQLIVAPRGHGEAFSAADHRLLTDLARQAGVVAHASQVTTALQQARLALVTAREEERRRLRRDLHDGLGPTLAGVTLGLTAARATIPAHPQAAADLIEQLSGQVEGAIQDIRRLVYGLRPPALDEYGLYRALQQHAATLEGTIAFTLTQPAGGLGDLPAAVDVAAYRIVTEAMTNVCRHAAATNCSVRVQRDQALQLTITDDGRGIRPGTAAGVGLTAMRERATELGGQLIITGTQPGTRIHAILPIPEVR